MTPVSAVFWSIIGISLVLVLVYLIGRYVIIEMVYHIGKSLWRYIQSLRHNEEMAWFMTGVLFFLIGLVGSLVVVAIPTVNRHFDGSGWIKFGVADALVFVSAWYCNRHSEDCRAETFRRECEQQEQFRSQRQRKETPATDEQSSTDCA